MLIELNNLFTCVVNLVLVLDKSSIPLITDNTKSFLSEKPEFSGNNFSFIFLTSVVPIAFFKILFNSVLVIDKSPSLINFCTKLNTPCDASVLLNNLSLLPVAKAK